MNNNNTKILLGAVKKWEKPEGKIIIGIDGYGEAGKTTLLKGVNEGNILIVNRDDFAIPRKDLAAKYKSARSDDEKVDIMVNKTINTKELISFLKQYKNSNEIIEWKIRDDITGLKNKTKKFDFSKRIMIIEGILLYGHNSLSNLIDRKVFVDIDQTEADKRRMTREKEKWGKDYFPDTHPDSYFRFIKIGFNDYLKNQNPKERADLVIEST